MRLRRPCEHGRYEHHFLVNNLLCRGGEFVTKDVTGKTRSIWWCETHEAEQVDGGYLHCFRGPSHYPTVEEERHRCRLVEMQLQPIHPETETSNV